MKRLIPYFLFSLFVPAFLACQENAQLDIYLVRSSVVDEDPLIPGVTTDVRMRITGPGMSPMEIIAPYKPGGAGLMPEVPTGKDRVITVEGLKSDGIVFSRGRSLPIDITDENEKLTLYIARIGRFSYAHDSGVTHARFGHAAAAAPDGTLYIGGGASEGDPTEPSAPVSAFEVFNPTDSSVRDLPCGENCGDIPGIFGNMLPLGDGLLALPGITEGGALKDNAAFITPPNDTITNPGVKITPRYGASAVSTGAFAVVAFGLDENREPLDTVEIFETNFQQQTLSVDAPRFGTAGAGTADRAVFFGGFDTDGAVTKEVFIIDPLQGSAEKLDVDLPPRALATAVALSDGRVLVIGGQDKDGNSSDAVDLIDLTPPATVCSVGRLRIGVRQAGAALLPDGRVLLVGGRTGGTSDAPTQTASILDPRYIDLTQGCNENTGTLFTTDVPPLGIPRYMPTVHAMENGTVAVIGGIGSSGRPVEYVEIFVPEE